MLPQQYQLEPLNLPDRYNGLAALTSFEIPIDPTDTVRWTVAIGYTDCDNFQDKVSLR